MTKDFIEYRFDVQKIGQVFAAYLRPHYLDGNPVEYVPIGSGLTPLDAISDLCRQLQIDKHPMARREENLK